jgi:hypothetical protein
MFMRFCLRNPRLVAFFFGGTKSGWLWVVKLTTMIAPNKSLMSLCQVKINEMRKLFHQQIIYDLFTLNFCKWVGYMKPKITNDE